jgi:hypothetical protein
MHLDSQKMDLIAAAWRCHQQRAKAAAKLLDNERHREKK